MRRRSVFAILLILCCANAVAAPTTDSGHAVFQRWCAGCHADSPLAPGTVALKASRGASAAVLEQRSDLSPVLIKTMVRRGYGGMPSFRRTEISADELDDLIAYLGKPSVSKVKP